MIKKCKDCGIEHENGDKYDKEGNPLNTGCFRDVCDSCQDIRMGLGLCGFCGVELTAENKWNKDLQAEYCQVCWDKTEELPPPVFNCSVCDSVLEQDPENLFEFWCPICLKKIMSLSCQ